MVAMVTWQAITAVLSLFGAAAVFTLETMEGVVAFASCLTNKTFPRVLLAHTLNQLDGGCSRDTSRYHSPFSLHCLALNSMYSVKMETVLVLLCCTFKCYDVLYHKRI